MRQRSKMLPRLAPEAVRTFCLTHQSKRCQSPTFPELSRSTINLSSKNKLVVSLRARPIIFLLRMTDHMFPCVLAHFPKNLPAFYLVDLSRLRSPPISQVADRTPALGLSKLKD